MKSKNQSIQWKFVGCISESDISYEEMFLCCKKHEFFIRSVKEFLVGEEEASFVTEVPIVWDKFKTRMIEVPDLNRK